MPLPKFNQRFLGQRKPEYLAWAALCVANGVRSYVELGAGSAHFLYQSGVPRVVGVDMLHVDNRHNPYQAGGVIYYRGDSHDLQTLHDVCVKLDGFPDAVFIDADHSYDAVRQDFDMWWPVATMLVGFHDILIPDVRRFWNEICLDITSAEIIGRDIASAKSWQGPGCPDDGVISGGGIGVLWK